MEFIIWKCLSFCSDYKPSSESWRGKVGAAEKNGNVKRRFSQNYLCSGNWVGWYQYKIHCDRENTKRRNNCKGGTHMPFWVFLFWLAVERLSWNACMLRSKCRSIRPFHIRPKYWFIMLAIFAVDASPNVSLFFAHAVRPVCVKGLAPER